MPFDHIMIFSEEELDEKKGYTSENSGFEGLFKLFPPNDILLFTAGPINKPPDIIQAAARKKKDGEDPWNGEIRLHPVTPIDDTQYEDESEVSVLGFKILNDYFQGVKAHLTSAINRKKENPVIITLSSGSALHSSILFCLGMGLNAKFVSIRRDVANNTAYVQSQDWIHAGFGTNLGGTADRKLQRNLLRSMLIARTLKGPLTKHVFSGELAHHECTSICSDANILPQPRGFSNSVRKLSDEEHGLIHIIGESKSSLDNRISELKKEIDELGTKFVHAEEKILEYGTDIDDLTELVKYLSNTEVTSENEKLVDTEIEDAGTRIDELSTKVNEIKDDQTETKNTRSTLKKERKGLEGERDLSTRYSLTSKGWIVSLKMMSDILKKSDTETMPLEGISIDDYPDLFQLFESSEESNNGVIMGVKAFKPPNSTEPLNAKGVGNTLLGSVDTVITMYVRFRDKVTAGTHFDLSATEPANPLKQIWRTGDSDSFEKYHDEWSSWLEDREKSHQHWCLFDAPSDELEESFRIMCEWLWPRLTQQSNHQASLNWSLDITQLGREQQLCAVLFASILDIPITWTKKRRAQAGERRKDVAVSSSNLSSHIIHLPIHVLTQVLIDEKPLQLGQEYKILVALYKNKQIWLRDLQSMKEQRQENPFDWENISGPGDLDIDLTGLHSTVNDWISEDLYEERFRLSSANPPHKREQDKLLTRGLIMLVKKKGRGGGHSMELTNLGELLAMSILERIESE